MTTAQKNALAAYRARLEARGLSRFEVLGRPADKALIRAVARALAEGGPDADALRAGIALASGQADTKGGVLAALRRSPLVGAELSFDRERTHPRAVDL